MIVRADGYLPLTTHIFDADSEYLESDAVFAVKPSLVREFVDRDADDPDTPPTIDGPWVSVESDIVLTAA
jgi:catechol 1,2-dioxygenase